MLLELPQHGRREVGVDEVGRGCLFGPVVAGAVLLPGDHDGYAFTDPRWAEIKDSKKLSEKRRNSLATFIKESCLSYGYGVISNDDIDKVNILKATYLAMNGALDNVYKDCVARSIPPFDFIRIDGPNFPGYLPPSNDDCVDHDCTPNGDAKILSIACASILAKTYRDQMVTSWVHAQTEPYRMYALERYGIHKNKGYGTQEHMKALEQYGPTPWHRKTFRGVISEVPESA